MRRPQQPRTTKGEDTLQIVLSGDNAITGSGYGISSGKGDIAISGNGSLTADGSMYGICNRGSIVIKGGTVAATGGDYGGIRAGDSENQTSKVTIEGGTVIATDETSFGYGIYGYGGIAIKGGTVEATGGYEGIAAYAGNVVIEGGAVTASGTNASSIGIFAFDGETKVGNGAGALTARGGSKAIYGKVKNDVPGIGWTDVEGTEGKAAIAVADEGRDLSAYKKLQFRAYTVTYKVVGGTWSDGGTTDNTENVLSGSKPVSVPTGMKASQGYTGGAWDKNPADATITGATTFTYTFDSEKPDPQPDPKPAGELSVAYSGHVQTYGDKAEVKDGATLGTTGEGKRLEALKVTVSGGSISYRAHAQGTGWQEWKKDGAEAGTHAQANRMEAVQIKLDDTLSKDYRVWYRVHSQTFGLLGWAKDGEPAGTTGLAKRAEAIEVQVLPQGAVPDGYDASVACAGEGARVCGQSVLALLGLCACDPQRIFVGVTRRVRRRLPPHVELRRVPPGERTTLYEGIASQPVALAIPAAWPEVMAERLVRAADEALRRGLLLSDEYDSVVGWLDGRV